jgi:hypothetical protein
MRQSNSAELTRWVALVRSEFLEIPGLSVTLAQGCRLWQLDDDTCSAVLQALVAAGFLRQRHDGMFVRAVIER